MSRLSGSSSTTTTRSPARRALGPTLVPAGSPRSGAARTLPTISGRLTLNVAPSLALSTHAAVCQCSPADASRPPAFAVAGACHGGATPPQARSPGATAEAGCLGEGEGATVIVRLPLRVSSVRAAPERGEPAGTS